jgi:hypothetical protein
VVLKLKKPYLVVMKKQYHNTFSASALIILFSVLLKLKKNLYVEKLKKSEKVAAKFKPMPSSLNTH